MNTTKIRHFPEIGRTYAVRAVPQAPLENAASDLYQGIPDIKVQLQIGEAKLHPLDQYCKKTGRHTAVNNIKPEVFQLAQVNVCIHGTYFVFVKEDFEIRLYKASTKDHAELSDISP